MSKEFEKARDEWLDHECQMSDHYDDYKDCCNWAYEFMCNENYQFALHRTWVSKCEDLEQKLKIATEAFSEIDNTLMTRNCGHCHCKTSRDYAFDIIKQTLEKIK